MVGLTSPGNVEFTESLGVYDRVVPYDAARLARARARRLRRHLRRRQDPERGPRPLGRSAQAQLRRRHHPSGGPGRRLRARRTQAGLLLRPGSAPQAHRGLGPRGRQQPARGDLGRLRRSGPATGSRSSTAPAPRTSSASTGSCSTANPTPRSDTYSRLSALPDPVALIVLGGVPAEPGLAPACARRAQAAIDATVARSFTAARGGSRPPAATPRGRARAPRAASPRR